MQASFELIYSDLAKTSPTAWSSLIEQAIRIATISFALPYLLTDTSTINAAYAMAMTALGEVLQH